MKHTDEGSCIVTSEEEGVSRSNLIISNGNIGLVHKQTEDKRQCSNGDHSKNGIAARSLQTLAQRRSVDIHRLIEEDGERQKSYQQHDE